MSASIQDDIHELRKWLNEEPNRPIDRAALARVLASQAPAPVDARSWYDLRPPTLELGRTYKTVSGKKVRMVSISNAGTDYESMADEDGHHRYSRSHGRIVGRCTGSKNDDPLNIPFDPPPFQGPAVKAEPLTGQEMRRAFEADYRKRHDSRLYCESEWRGWQAGVAACISGAALSKPPVQGSE